MLSLGHATSPSSNLWRSSTPDHQTHDYQIKLRAGIPNRFTVLSCALRAPRHLYGGPEPFGTGAGIIQWEAQAGDLLFNHHRVEREKEWKRWRHRLVRQGPTPEDEQALGPEGVQAIEHMQQRVRFRKFWDLMNERDRPWHYDVVVRMCTELSPYSCERYNSVTAGTMQRILAQRAQAEKAVRDLRTDATSLRRGFTGAIIAMQRSGVPVSDERVGQLRRLLAVVSAGAGGAATKLRVLQRAAGTTFQDSDYAAHVERLLPLLKEIQQVAEVARRHVIPTLEDLKSELIDFQDALEARALPRDQVLATLQELRNRQLLPASAVPTVDHAELPDAVLSATAREPERYSDALEDASDGEEAAEGVSGGGGRRWRESAGSGGSGGDVAWPYMTPDAAVGWRYPPLSYWRPKPSEIARRGARGLVAGRGGERGRGSPGERLRDGEGMGEQGAREGPGDLGNGRGWGEGMMGVGGFGRAGEGPDGGEGEGRGTARGWGDGQASAEAAMMEFVLASFGAGGGGGGGVGDMGIDGIGGGEESGARGRGESGGQLLPGLFD